MEVREIILQFYLKPCHFQGFRDCLFTQSFPLRQGDNRACKLLLVNY